MAHLSLSLLGSFAAVVDSRPLAGFESDKARALLAYLAMEAERAHPRDKLAALIWPEWPEEAARARLRNTLANLRQVLGDAQNPAAPLLLITRESVQFNPASDHWLDARAFGDQISTERWQEAVALYRGEFLEGLALKDSAPFEDWALLTRERLRGTYLTALRRLAGQCEQRGDAKRAEGYLRRVLELEPWEEEVHRALMRALAASGQRSAALAQYEKCVEALRAELGAQPETETTQLAEQIRAGQGEAGKGRPASRLPTPLLPLIGREGELGQLLDALRDAHCRLLSLVGPGGAGKTRLALEAAIKLEGLFARGVHYVPLAAVEAVEGMVPAIAQGVGFSFYSQPGSTPKQQLLDYLRDKELLLVLDNCEHLLAGAGLISEILEAAPRSKVLATTRARLALLGEQCLMLGGLRCPALTPDPSPKGGGEEKKRVLPLPLGEGLTTGEGYPAVQLFLESARRVRPGYAPTAEELAQIGQICRWVEGMPLAILLASSWMEMLSPGEIVAQMAGADGQRLDLLAADYQDLPERQRSMRAVLDHSWRLLGEREQGALAALSVFHGSFTAEAAQAVAGASLRDLLRLVDRSLLQRSDGRYALHDLLRQYAAEKLAAAEQETAARDRHAAYYAQTLEAWRADIYSPRQAAFVRAMTQESVNILAAWEWALQRARLDWVDQMQDSLTRWHVFQARVPDIDHLLSRAIPVVEQAAPSGKRAKTLAGLLSARAVIVYVMGDAAAARMQMPRCFPLLEEAEQAGEDVRYERVKSLRRMGAYGTASCPEQIVFLECAVEAARALGNRGEETAALQFLGLLANKEGQRQRGQQLLEDAVVICREIGVQSDLVKALGLLTQAAWEDGRWSDLPRLVSELQAVTQATDDAEMRIYALRQLGANLRYLGRHAEALAAFERGIAICEEQGDRYQLIELMSLVGRNFLQAGRYAEGREYNLRLIALAQQANYRNGQYSAFYSLAWAAIQEGSPADLEEWWDNFAEYHHRLGLQNSYFHVLSAWADCRRGRLAEAQRSLREAMQDTFVSSSPVRLCVDVLPCLALTWAKEGQVERAVELDALCHKVLEGGPPFPCIEDMFFRPLAEAATSLPPEVVKAGQARGRARDWEATAKELLAELA